MAWDNQEELPPSNSPSIQPGRVRGFSGRDAVNSQIPGQIHGFMAINQEVRLSSGHIGEASNGLAFPIEDAYMNGLYFKAMVSVNARCIRVHLRHVLGRHDDK